MHMVFFKNKAIEIFQEKHDDTCGKDLHGKPKKCFIKIGEAEGNFKPLSKNESLKEFGDIVQDSYQILVEPSVVIDSSCRVKVQGFQNMFLVNGDPNDCSLFLPQKKVILYQEGFESTEIVEPEGET
jgi:hypothetical protein